MVESSWETLFGRSTPATVLGLCTDGTVGEHLAEGEVFVFFYETDLLERGIIIHGFVYVLSMRLAFGIDDI
jgi:hypothetical protein